MKYCDIYLVRHGETDWNAQGLLQGQTDIPLNQDGEKQAQQLTQMLAHVPFKVAFSSDLSRAFRTAEIVLHNRPIKIEKTPLLRERFMGSFEGKKWIELDNCLKPQVSHVCQLPKNDYLAYQWHPEIETSSTVFCRFKTILDQIVYNNLGETVLIVSHGALIRSVLEHIELIPGYKWNAANCGYVHLKVSQEEIILHHSHKISQSTLS